MKTCSRCKNEKPLDDFNKWTKGRDGRQPYCRICTSAYYQGNAVKHKAAVAARNKRIREGYYGKIHAYLLEHPCVDCGETDPIVLDFDHVRGKKIGHVSSLVRSLVRWELIAAEIAKCEVRCANCHRRKTARELGYHSYLRSRMGL